MKIKKEKGESLHHRCPQSLGGQKTKENISVVDIKKHECWHTLFANMTPYEIAKVINSVWLDPSYQFLCVNKRPDDTQRLAHNY